jgi:hypothetical protein
MGKGVVNMKKVEGAISRNFLDARIMTRLLIHELLSPEKARKTTQVHLENLVN